MPPQNARSQIALPMKPPDPSVGPLIYQTFDGQKYIVSGDRKAYWDEGSRSWFPIAKQNNDAEDSSNTDNDNEDGDGIRELDNVIKDQTNRDIIRIPEGGLVLGKEYEELLNNHKEVHQRLQLAKIHDQNMQRFMAAVNKSAYYADMRGLNNENFNAWEGLKGGIARVFKTMIDKPKITFDQSITYTVRDGSAATTYTTSLLKMLEVVDEEKGTLRFEQLSSEGQRAFLSAWEQKSKEKDSLFSTIQNARTIVMAIFAVVGLSFTLAKVFVTASMIAGSASLAIFMTVMPYIAAITGIITAAFLIGYTVYHVRNRAAARKQGFDHNKLRSIDDRARDAHALHERYDGKAASSHRGFNDYLEMEARKQMKQQADRQRQMNEQVQQKQQQNNMQTAEQAKGNNGNDRLDNQNQATSKVNNQSLLPQNNDRNFINPNKEKESLFPLPKRRQPNIIETSPSQSASYNSNSNRNNLSNQYEKNHDNQARRNNNVNSRYKEASYRSPAMQRPIDRQYSNNYDNDYNRYGRNENSYTNLGSYRNAQNSYTNQPNYHQYQSSYNSLNSQNQSRYQQPSYNDNLSTQNNSYRTPPYSSYASGNYRNEPRDDLYRPGPTGSGYSSSGRESSASDSDLSASRIEYKNADENFSDSDDDNYKNPSHSSYKNSHQPPSYNSPRFNPHNNLGQNRNNNNSDNRSFRPIDYVPNQNNNYYSQPYRPVPVRPAASYSNQYRNESKHNKPLSSYRQRYQSERSSSDSDGSRSPYK